MISNQILGGIRKAVHTFLPGSTILLFGSRARGDQKINSDYDIMIITPNSLSQKEKVLYSAEVNNAIIKSIDIPVDLLINSQDEFQRKSALPGHISRTILKEGLVI